MFVIKYKGKNLSEFAPNDLPVKKYDSKKDRFYYSFNNIIKFSNKNYNMFFTYQDAYDYKHFVCRELSNYQNFKRYKEIVKDGSLSKLGTIINNLKICEENI